MDVVPAEADLVSRVSAFYLTPPPTSADIEQVFSTAGNGKTIIHMRKLETLEFSMIFIFE